MVCAYILKKTKQVLCHENIVAADITFKIPGFFPHFSLIKIHLLDQIKSKYQMQYREVQCSEHPVYSRNCPFQNIHLS